MSSNTTWPPESEAELRKQLLWYYSGLTADAAEGALVARGIENRQSAEDLVTLAAVRAAEYYGILKAMLPGRALPEQPTSLSISVPLMLEEVRDLADMHDRVADESERTGHLDHAWRRRDRATQLRVIAGEGK